MATEDDKGRERDKSAVGGVGEVTEPSWRQQEKKKGKGVASDKLRIAMEEMNVGKDETDKWEAEEADKDGAENKGGYLGGGC